MVVKMAMSEQLETEGGKSLFLTFSLLSFSQLIQKAQRSDKSKTAEKNVFLDVPLYLLVFRELQYKSSPAIVTLTKVN